MSMVEAAGGVRLYVEAHGDGIPVILSCAFATTHENFRPQVEPLVAGGARVRLVGEDLEIDLTDDAVSQLLLKHLLPRYRAILQSAK